MMAQIAYIKDYKPGTAQLSTELRRVDQAFEQLMAELLELHAECESNGSLGCMKAEVDTALIDAQRSLQGLKQAIAAHEQSPSINDPGAHR